MSIYELKLLRRSETTIPLMSVISIRAVIKRTTIREIRPATTESSQVGQVNHHTVKGNFDTVGQEIVDELLVQ